jgi:glycosyltransferase involved in cell wall biosynthesis
VGNGAFASDVRTVGPLIVDAAPPVCQPQQPPTDLQELSWICCQLGAREHYAVPRALQRAGKLASFVTDLWVSPSSLVCKCYPRRARDRYHSELDTADVRAHSMASTLLEIPRRLSKLADWDRIIDRNHQFERLALRDLHRIARQHHNTQLGLFSFSYAARPLLEFAKTRGWTTVLGQIDGGPGEEQLVSRLQESPTVPASRRQLAPAAYWHRWRDECALADKIVVNSTWSRQLLVGEGIPTAKICVIPLAYERSAAQAAFRRKYPESFSPDRPLRVLFLGQLTVRKGIAAVFEAMRSLASLPVEFWFVGPSEVDIPHAVRHSVNSRWYGAVPRSEVAPFYRDADLFLLPTFSDGFGITQLEAQAWNLPLITSRFCGEVVSDGVNGVVLPEISASAIVETLQHLIRTPATLAAMSNRPVNLDNFSIDRLSARLTGLP